MTTKELNKINTDLEDGIVIQIDNNFIEIHIGHDNIECEEFDSYLDYTLYNSTYEDIDGGQLDYDSTEINYEENPEFAIEEILNSFDIVLSEEGFKILSEEEKELFFDKIEEFL